MAVIGILDILFRANNTQFTKTAEDTTKKAKKLGKDVKEAVPPTVFDALGSRGNAVLTSIATKALGVITAFFAVKKIIGETTSQIERMGQLYKDATKLGVSVQDLIPMQMVFAKAGIDASTLDSIVLKLQGKLAQAAGGSKQLNDAFGALGLSVAELRSLSPADQLAALADALKAIPDQGEKVKALMGIFGKAGVELAGAFNLAFKDGGKAIDDMRAKAERFGLLITDQQAKEAAAAKRAMNEAKQAAQGIWTSIATHTSGQVERFFTNLTELFVRVRPLVEKVADLASSALEKLEEAADKLQQPKRWKGWFPTQEDVQDENSGIYTQVGHRTAPPPTAKEIMEQGDSLDDLIAKWRQQAETFGMTTRQAEIYRAVSEGVDQELLEQAKAVDQQLTALEVQKEIWEANPIAKAQRTLAGYRTALEQSAITQSQYNELVRRLQQEIGGATTAYEQHLETLRKLEQARSLLTTGQYNRAVAEENERWRKASEAIASFNLSPLEQYRKRIEELNKALKDHSITQEQFNRASREARGILGVGKSPSEQIAEYKSQRDILRKWRDEGQISSGQYAEAARKNLPDFVRGLIDETETPLEKFKRGLRELQDWRKAGLNETLFNRGVLALRKSTLGSENRFADIAELGSREAYQAILRHQYGAETQDDQKKMVKTLVDQYGEAQTTNRKLDKLIEQGGTRKVVSLPAA